GFHLPSRVGQVFNLPFWPRQVANLPYEVIMKVSIIGGGGLVGSMTAYALQCGGVASHICLIDANKEMAQGQATDLLHGASLVADQRISAGDFDEVANSNIVVITAGLRRKPDES